jgi:hypothetical protein
MYSVVEGVMSETSHTPPSQSSMCESYSRFLSKGSLNFDYTIVLAEKTSVFDYTIVLV